LIFLQKTAKWLFLSVGFFIFVGLFVNLPLGRVIPCSLSQYTDLRHNFSKHVKQRRNNKVCKTRLRLADLSSLSIAEERYWKLLMFLKITLSEELVEEQVSPLPSNVERTGLGRNVCCVYADFKKLLLTVEFLRWVGLVDQVLCVLTLLDFVFFDD
jgi:hypothetical protein